MSTCGSHTKQSYMILSHNSFDWDTPGRDKLSQPISITVEVPQEIEGSGVGHIQLNQQSQAKIIPKRSKANLFLPIA